MAVAFLTAHTKHPDEDDWSNLMRVLKYLNGTRGLILTLCVDELSIVKWWLDASNVLHKGYKVQTGVMMSISKGTITSLPKKKKDTRQEFHE